MNVDARILQGRGIHVRIEDKTILNDVDIDVRKGEVVGLIGPNGAGKTTLIRVLAGVAPPARGTVSIDGADAGEMNRLLRARRVAYLPQGAEVNWPLTVASVVALGRFPYRKNFVALGAEDDEAIERALLRTETSSLRERAVGTLSGGERMRVLVARMLAVEAEVLLADEPVAALDPYYQLEFMDLFAEEAAAGCGVVLVLHDLALAARYCSRLVLLDAGNKIAEGSPAEVLTDELLDRVYRIRALTGTRGGKRYVLPWQRRPG